MVNINKDSYPQSFADGRRGSIDDMRSLALDRRAEFIQVFLHHAQYLSRLQKSNNTSQTMLYVHGSEVMYLTPFSFPFQRSSLDAISRHPPPAICPSRSSSTVLFHSLTSFFIESLPLGHICHSFYLSSPSQSLGTQYSQNLNICLMLRKIFEYMIHL